MAADEAEPVPTVAAAAAIEDEDTLGNESADGTTPEEPAPVVAAAAAIAGGGALGG